MKLALLAILALLLAGCSKSSSTGSPGTISLQIGDERFTLEVADTDALREKGLMHREAMPADHGMIFVFRHRSFPRFWMRNTRIPLDILFVDKGGAIVSIRSLKPFDETGVTPSAPCLYAIELNAGAAARAGVREGSALQLPPLEARD